MSYPNPVRLRRTYRKRYSNVVGYEIAFGSPSEVVERVNELIKDGWEPFGDTLCSFSGGDVYACQPMILRDRKVDEVEDDSRNDQTDPKAVQ